MRIDEEWNNTPVIARVALITSVIEDHQSEPRRFGSAPWDKVPGWLQERLTPIFMPADTDASDRTVHAGWSGGKPVYRASMAGHCMKELWLWRTGAADQFDPNAPGRDPYRDKGELGAQEGSLHETWMVDALKQEGFEITNAGGDQDELEVRYKRFVVRSHPDGLIRGLEVGSDWRVLECKALNEDRFNMWKSLGWDAFRNYAYQMTLEMYLASKKYSTETKGFFYVKNRNTGETLRTMVNTYPVDPATIINRFSEIENLVINGGKPPCDPEAEWYWCPFLGAGHCDAVKRKDGAPVLEVEDDGFMKLLTKLKEAKATAKNAAAEAQGLRTLIMERMVEPALKIGPYFAKVSTRTRVGFNIPMAKGWIGLNGGDPDSFNKETTYEELRVTGGIDDDDTSGF